VRWITIAIVWQGVVLVGCWVYLLTFSHQAPGIAWASPAIGATFGTALPLQFVVVAAIRSARR
jgi:hypothetical protein